MGIFAPDGKLARFLNRIGDLIVVNLIALACCIPIVTIGASMTALYTVTMKMARNEDGKLVTAFFKAFRDNFKQATILWAINGGILAFIVLDLYLMRSFGGTMGMVYKGILLAIFALVSMITMYLFPVLARFDNSTKITWKNAALFCISKIFKSILMLIVTVIPIVLLAISFRFTPIVFILGLSGPAYLTSIYYRALFEPFENTEAVA